MTHPRITRQRQAMRTPRRKDHGPAILRFLKKGPKSLAQIIAHLRLDNAPDQADYDIRKLRIAGKVQSVRRKWERVT